MTKLIADSGSTKTEWMLISDEGSSTFFVTDGLNPYYRSEMELIVVITDGLLKDLDGDSVDEIYFYGAGCGRSSTKETMAKAISSCFRKATVHVESDLLGAARACFGDQEGVVCILGTGSNSCLYDGKQITKNIPSLGFTLGDEGSGGYFGKKILHGYFYETMPRELRSALEEKFDMNLDRILKKVYSEPKANQFVASFAKLLWDFKDHQYIKDLLRKGFEEFADKQLSYFGDLAGQTIGFVGSIAAIHEEILKDVLNERGMKLFVVIQKPVERLVGYHEEG